jgi:glycosyltransferase involved in cell wall biosynthesis
MYLPYNGALAGSRRTASYLEFLGVPKKRIFTGYDTVSVMRIRELADAPPAPDGVPHAKRHFTVIARFVPKKNLSMALEAYALYLAARPNGSRELHFCGSGELEAELRARVAALGLTGVKFLGFLQERGIANELAGSLALILPSVEEQYGLVVNEAIAMGVPLLLSDNCGARDVLLRSGINGYIVEPDNPAGLAHYMAFLDRDRSEWERLSRNCRDFVPLADAPRFAEAVERVLASFDRRYASPE